MQGDDIMTQLSSGECNFPQLCLQTQSGAMLEHLARKHKLPRPNLRKCWGINLAMIGEYNFGQ
eukprot:11309758-Karenia_brevis.AAC.1